MNYLVPQEIAAGAAKTAGVKAGLASGKTVILGFLAGAFIAFGAEASTTVAHDLPGVGLARLVSGMVFSTGLMMVMIAGAELFTGNVLVWMGVLERKVSLFAMLRNWVLVYFSNFAGALAVVFFMNLSGLWAMNNNLVGAYAIKIATGKCALSFTSALVLGLFCNWLVCMAVWMSWASKDIVGKVFAIFFPITLFVASNFEHSIANMYYIPAGILAKENPAALAASHMADKVGVLNWSNFFTHNLIPVTIGNIIGGALFVATLYWFAYLRGAKHRAAEAMPETFDPAVVESLIDSAFVEKCPAFKACPAMTHTKQR